MFWRKTKSEVASMAATEVEKLWVWLKRIYLEFPKHLQQQQPQQHSTSPSNPGIAKNSNTASTAKRSLSLMRKEFFKNSPSSKCFFFSSNSVITERT